MSIRVERLGGRALLYCLLLAMTTVANAQSRYRVTQLPAPSGGGSWEFRDLNDNGELLVRSQGEGYVIQDQRLLSVNSRLPGNPDYIYVGGFNNKRQVVGAYQDAQAAFTHFVLSGSRVWPSPFGDDRTLYDITDAGHVLGFAAVAYQGRIRYLTTANGTTDYVDAVDINANGDVAGSDYSEYELDQTGEYATGVAAALWHCGRFVRIGGLPSAVTSYGVALNDRKQVLGVSVFEGGEWDPESPVPPPRTSRAFIWEKGQIRALPLVYADQTRASPADINNAGDAVGSTSVVSGNGVVSENRTATLWRRNAAFDLNQRLVGSEGVYLDRALAINERGQIAAAGLTEDNEPALFLLNPVK